MKITKADLLLSIKEKISYGIFDTKELFDKKHRLRKVIKDNWSYVLKHNTKDYLYQCLLFLTKDNSLENQSYVVFLLTKIQVL